MLPSRFSLTKQAEETLKRNKGRTGIPPNIMARDLFFRSIELGPIIDKNFEFRPGQMSLEKSVWLGSLELVTEQALKSLYGNIGSDVAAKKWALHVENAMLLQEL
ncbi:MAG: DndE family protein [Pseudomonadota bacterium]